MTTKQDIQRTWAKLTPEQQDELLQKARKTKKLGQTDIERLGQLLEKLAEESRK